MRTLMLLLMLVTTGCYHGAYHGQHSGWQSYRSGYSYVNMHNPRREATPSLPERVRAGRLEGERRLQQTLERMRRR